MESSFGNFHFEIKHATFSAFGIITDRGEWKMLSCSPDSGWPQQPTRRQGTWARTGQVARCYALGTGSDAASSNNQTSIEVFRLTDLDFSARSLLDTQQGFWIKQFFIGDQWADEKHIQKGIIPTPDGPKKLGMPTHGTWNAVISGPLIRAVEIELRECHEEMKRLAIQIGLDIASMVDPTGLCSVPAAAYAMNRGDYLGCCVNLLGVIPLFGKLAPAAKLAEVSPRLAFLATKITFYEKWLEISTDATRRVRQVVAGALKVDIQGTTKASMLPRVVKAATEAGAGLKNQGWILKIFNPDNVGILPEELAVLRSLAKDGYYFVVRSCNPTRVKWLRQAAQNGWGMIGKPVWLKIKSLKNVKFEGLVGFAKKDVEFWQTIERLEVVKEVPSSVRLDWLAAKGMSAKDVKVYKLTKDFNVPHVEDAHMMLTHYFVDTGDAFIIVDRFGKPYVPDLDVVTIQRAMGGGRFGPPGYKIGPANPVTKFRGADNAEMSSFWNQRFRSIRYPPGYEPFGWHGGWGGSAQFIKAVEKDENGKILFDASMDVRSLGWNPEKPGEDLIVAIHGVEGLGDDVGYVKGWDKLGAFQRANSGMGEYRFEIGKK
jgi:hypothetical protein